LAEDLTQDVFVKALQAFESYDPAISRSSWILTIARNHLINQLEKIKPQVKLDDVENILPDPLCLAHHAQVRQDECRLLEAISGLPDDDAELVRLKYLEGWTYQEIAKITGKTSGTLRVQAYRALRMLKAALKQNIQ
jgi:RNA polymerase sigma-70 factor (ECF subfamily)